MSETVTIPMAEYLRLKEIEEDFADLQSASAILRRIEAGRKTGSVATLRKLASALKVDIEDVIPNDE